MPLDVRATARTHKPTPPTTASTPPAAVSDDASSGEQGNPLGDGVESGFRLGVEVREGQHAEVAGVLDIEAKVRVARGDELLRRGSRLVERGREEPLFHLERALDEGEVEPFLAAEM